MEQNTTHTEKKILIVENDTVITKILAHTLTQNGFSVAEARDGIEGIETAATQKPDLILLDIDMPKMDGLTMLKELRKSGDTTPIIMLTNLNNPDYIADAAEHGVREYLIKADWEIDEIAAKVKAKLHL
jgi:two-component system response regulator MprA